LAAIGVAFVLLLVVAIAPACKRPAATELGAEPSPSARLTEGARYLDDPAFRRRALVGSLTNPDNTYSRLRLTSYGLGDRGWDALPEWNPRSVVLGREAADALRSGARLGALGPETAPLWDGVRPTTAAGWAALGREVFFRYPLRREVYVEWGIANGSVGDRAGVRPLADGSYPGAVVFVDLRGQTQVGMTCAMCHADVTPGGRGLVVGQARRAFDYGALRLAYHAATNTFVEADLARRMKTWGPGRADVTEDDDEDPVAIPDLWGLSQQTFLTQAGTIKHTGPAALAIRQETQLLTSNHQAIRPPRELAFALAMFLYSLRPPTALASQGDPAADLKRGRAIYQTDCTSCHSNIAGGGEPVAAAEVGTDPALANGHARGTGRYRPPALVHVAEAGPYLHDGSLASLEDVLSSDRFEPGFKGGVVHAGPVLGHRYGTDLPLADRTSLIAYLRTL
jgi:cytochrome c5